MMNYLWYDLDALRLHRGSVLWNPRRFLFVGFLWSFGKVHRHERKEGRKDFCGWVKAAEKEEDATFSFKRTFMWLFLKNKRLTCCVQLKRPYSLIRDSKDGLFRKMSEYNSLAIDLDLGGGVLLFITRRTVVLPRYYLDNGLFLNFACHLTESN